MKILKSIFIKIIFYIFLISFYVIFFEITSRIIISATSKNFDIIKYGFNKNLIFEVADLSKFEFTVYDIGLDQEKYLKKNLDKNEKTINENKKNLTIWTFGASLTYGYACGEVSSSWPDELAKKNKKLKVKNFAFPAKYSDDSIKTLIYNYKNKKVLKPDLIIWSHRDEEILSIFRGLKRNKNRINNNFSFQTTNSIYFNILTIDKTLKSNFSFYIILNHIIDKLKIRFNLGDNNIERKKLTFNDYSIAIKNFELNTTEAINLSNKNNIQKFIILSLFSNDEIDNSEENKLIKKYFKTLNKLKNYKNVQIINTIESLSNEDKLNKDNYFCKNKHFNLNGNKLISDFIYRKLFINQY